jgi:hypothetical protein
MPRDSWYVWSQLGLATGKVVARRLALWKQKLKIALLSFVSYLSGQPLCCLGSLFCRLGWLETEWKIGRRYEILVLNEEQFSRLEEWNRSGNINLRVSATGLFTYP